MIWLSRILHIYRHALRRGALLGALAAMGVTSVAVDAQTLLQSNARYPRIRMLPSGELIATMLIFPTDYRVKVFSSTNNGASWTHVGWVSEADFPTLHTSSPDFMVLPNGDLILGINVDTAECSSCYSKIRIYRSTDDGRNWSYLSTAATASNNKGFWEPNFSIASDGALVLTYADETSSCCKQKLMRIRSYDNGATWQDRSNLVALSTDSSHPDYEKRPGMPVVTKLTDGTGRWLMTYEVCGVAQPNNCRHHYKTSTDGWNYGTVSDVGTEMTGHHGRYFNGTPMTKAVPSGPLLWIGHFLRLADGTYSAANGDILFKSPNGDPAGPWEPINAPVMLNDPQSPGCEGFSPTLQWVNNGSGGKTLIHMSSIYNASTSACDMYYGSAAL